MSDVLGTSKSSESQFKKLLQHPEETTENTPLVEESQSEDHIHNNEDGNEHESDFNELHPIELTAHTILSGSLDHLHDDFELLSQSQYILLTRLKLIEDRLKSFEKVAIEDDNMTKDKEVLETFNKIRELKRRLNTSMKTLHKVETRVEKMNHKLGHD